MWFFLQLFCSSGIKQGGVLSPLLFCVYLDGLLLALSNCHVGCFIGDVFTGALAYADDIMLNAPIASALRNMLAVCDKYAADFDMSFNAHKSKCMIVLPPSQRYLEPQLNSIHFMIGGRMMEIVSSYSYLGHIISSTAGDSLDVSKRQHDFNGHINDMLCFFGKLPSIVKSRLFCSYCTSFYGCELWDLSCDQIIHFCTAWRKGLRRVWDLPYQTHKFPTLVVFG